MSNETITIDNKEYKRNSLSKEADSQIVNIQVSDTEIHKLQTQLNITKTAKAAYINELAKHLPQKEATANKKKDLITIDNKKYNFEDFNEQGKAQLVSVQQCELKINTLETELAIAQTARNAYANALNNELR